MSRLLVHSNSEFAAYLDSKAVTTMGGNCRAYTGKTQRAVKSWSSIALSSPKRFLVKVCQPCCQGVGKRSKLNDGCAGQGRVREFPGPCALGQHGLRHQLHLLQAPRPPTRGLRCRLAAALREKGSCFSEGWEGKGIGGERGVGRGGDLLRVYLLALASSMGTQLFSDQGVFLVLAF